MSDTQALQRSTAETLDWGDLEGGDLDPTTAYEYGGGGTTRASNGIRNLMIAVLEDAIRGYVGGDARERHETEVWLSNREPNFPFAFTVICDTLGLEPDAVRQAMRRMRRETVPLRRAVIRARRNGRRFSPLASLRK